MSALLRPPTCSRVRYSVQATCTQDSAPAARPVVSSACSSGAVDSSSCRCGKNFSASLLGARGRILTGDPGGATTAAFASSAPAQSAQVTAPQVQVLASSWYSVISGACTGGRSTTCRRSATAAAAPTSDPWQPEH